MQSDASGTILVFSDLHFNPMYDPALTPALAASDPTDWDAILAASDTGYSVFGTDSNHALFQSTLDSMAQKAGNVDFIIFPGDFLAHKFEERYAEYAGDPSSAGLQAFTAKTMAYITAEVSARFPGIPIYFALGNNDSTYGDYKIAPTDPFLADTAPIFAATFLSAAGGTDAFATTYAAGGYYSLAVPDQDLTIIALNDIYWSHEYADTGPGLIELAWLSGELARAAANLEKVWVVTHIPPGLNSKGTADAAKDGTYKASYEMNPAFNNAFTALLTAYGDTVAATIAGHAHRDDVRLIPDPTLSAEPEAMIRIVPSISPIDYNNPGYQIYSYTQGSYALTDQTTYYLDLQSATPAWSTEYVYSQTYGLTLDDPSQWTLWHDALLLSPTAGQAYQTAFDISLPEYADINAGNLGLYWMAISYTTTTGIETAIEALNLSSADPLS